jgi:hypothetical protein
VQERCAQSGTVDYCTYLGREHVGVVAADSSVIPDLVVWTRPHRRQADTVHLLELKVLPLPAQHAANARGS